MTYLYAMRTKALFICLLTLVFGTGMRFSSTITIVIDAGHGGKDPGHLSHSKSHKTEKEINLLIANYLGGYIEQYLDNVNVIYTRTTDKFLSLDERVELANSNSADYFISIHCNGNPKKNIYGTETHIHAFSAEKSFSLAKEIESQFSFRAGRISRGVKNNDDRAHSIQVLKFTNMTSVLVECGFLTNSPEASYLNSTHGQEILASAIFRAFRASAEKQHPHAQLSKEDQNGNYTIQLMSSKKWVDTIHESFKRLKMDVSRVELNTTKAYKYIYYAGDFSTKADAETALTLVQNKGYPDALLVQKAK
jgi:N-acetylmuramoyl-L-alanine amidase